MATVPLTKPKRSPWNGFPDVVIVADETAVKRHAEYGQAKAGNVNDAAAAAKRLPSDFVTPKALDDIRRLPVTGAALVPYMPWKPAVLTASRQPLPSCSQRS